MNDAMCLVDIARHFSVLDDLAPVKVSFENGRVTAEAMNGRFDEQSLAAARLSLSYEGIATVLCYGEFEGKAPAVASIVFLPAPALLRGFADLHPGVVPQIMRRQDSCGSSWLEVEFDVGDGETCHARLQSAAYANYVANVPPLLAFVPEVRVCPSVHAVKLMKTLANRAKKQNVRRFWAAMSKRGRLYFSFDFESSSNPPACFEVASGLTYCKLRPYSYDAASVLKVLALADPGRPVAMSFLNAGLLVLEVVSAYGGRYKFVFRGDDELVSDSELALDLVKQLASGNAEDASMYFDCEFDL